MRDIKNPVENIQKSYPGWIYLAGTAWILETNDYAVTFKRVDDLIRYCNDTRIRVQNNLALTEKYREQLKY